VCVCVCVCRCFNATQLVFYKSWSNRRRRRLFDAARRRAPGNERLHLIRRKWKRNHAQKTPTGGSRRRVRYSASVERLFGGGCAECRVLQRRSLVVHIASVLSADSTWTAYTLPHLLVSFIVSLSVSFCLPLCVSAMRLESKYSWTLTSKC